MNWVVSGRLECGVVGGEWSAGVWCSGAGIGAGVFGAEDSPEQVRVVDCLNDYERSTGAHTLPAGGRDGVTRR